MEHLLFFLAMFLIPLSVGKSYRAEALRVTNVSSRLRDIIEDYWLIQFGMSTITAICGVMLMWSWQTISTGHMIFLLAVAIIAGSIQVVISGIPAYVALKDMRDRQLRRQRRPKR